MTWSTRTSTVMRSPKVARQVSRQHLTRWPQAPRCRYWRASTSVSRGTDPAPEGLDGATRDGLRWNRFDGCTSSLLAGPDRLSDGAGLLVVGLRGLDERQHQASLRRRQLVEP